MCNSKLVDNCLKGEVNTAKNRAASSLAERNEARWVFQSNRTRPSEWFKAQSEAECAGWRSGLWWTDYFIQPLQVGVSRSLLCYFVLSLREGEFKIWHRASCPAGVRAALLCGVDCCCHGNKKPPQPRQRSTAPSLCLPWELATAAETSFPAGELSRRWVSRGWLKCTDPTWCNWGL